MKNDRKADKKVSKVDENKLNRIVEIISKKCNPEKIILSGSYAYGIPGKDSDLDMLVVVKDSCQPRYKRAGEIRKNLWGIIDIPKDILIYFSLSEGS